MAVDVQEKVQHLGEGLHLALFAFLTEVEQHNQQIGVVHGAIAI
jgi:hypothetical protein